MFKFCVLGATNEDLADFFQVSTSTIDNWLKVHPDFLGALKSGKMQADAEVADSLYHRGLGFSHPSEIIKVVSPGVKVTSSSDGTVTVQRCCPPQPLKPN